MSEEINIKNLILVRLSKTIEANTYRYGSSISLFSLIQVIVMIYLLGISIYYNNLGKQKDVTTVTGSVCCL